jgi:hypothetical protein
MMLSTRGAEPSGRERGVVPPMVGTWSRVRSAFPHRSLPADVTAERAAGRGR